MSNLKQESDDARHQYEEAAQARRMAEFEFIKAVEERMAAVKRFEEADNALRTAREKEASANKVANEKFFALARAQIKEEGVVRG